jgi:hypothetical protein
VLTADRDLGPAQIASDLDRLVVLRAVRAQPELAVGVSTPAKQCAIAADRAAVIGADGDLVEAISRRDHARRSDRLIAAALHAAAAGAAVAPAKQRATATDRAAVIAAGGARDEVLHAADRLR